MNRKLLLGIFCGLVEQNKTDIPELEEQKVFEIRKENIFVNPPVLMAPDLSSRRSKNKKYFVPKTLGKINTKSKRR